MKHDTLENRIQSYEERDVNLGAPGGTWRLPGLWRRRRWGTLRSRRSLETRNLENISVVVRSPDASDTAVVGDEKGPRSIASRRQTPLRISPTGDDDEFRRESRRPESERPLDEWLSDAGAGDKRRDARQEAAPSSPFVLRVARSSRRRRPRRHQIDSATAAAASSCHDASAFAFSRSPGNSSSVPGRTESASARGSSGRGGEDNGESQRSHTENRSSALSVSARTNDVGSLAKVAGALIKPRPRVSSRGSSRASRSSPQGTVPREGEAPTKGEGGKQVWCAWDRRSKRIWRGFELSAEETAQRLDLSPSMLLERLLSEDVTVQWSNLVLAPHWIGIPVPPLLVKTEALRIREPFWKEQAHGILVGRCCVQNHMLGGRRRPLVLGRHKVVRVCSFMNPLG
uniref:CorA family Mg2+ transporter protein n=1 Tax=Steinernema glaseri TaxID=37863 RepID=A0A1I8AUW9_9BILA